MSNNASNSIPLSASEDKSDNRSTDRLLEVYKEAIRPVETLYHYEKIAPGDFTGQIEYQKPCISFFGPWSCGKSTFINHLLQSNNLWTGPQPTTAEFTVVMYGNEAGPVDGQALVNAKRLPFHDLSQFGDEFIRHLKGYQVPHPLLKHVTLIDTPGIVESADERHGRTYDYHGMSRWFAEHSDLIFVLFDPSKLDSGKELKTLFESTLLGVEDRVRIILNKADSVTSQELMKVYGSLFWNLSNIVRNTEPPRVYVGSFWDQPYQEDSFTILFSEEKADLMSEILQSVPLASWDKKVASVIQRGKSVLAHAGVCSAVHSDVPVFNKSKHRRQSASTLSGTYDTVAAKYNLNTRNFPDPSLYAGFFQTYDPEKMPSADTVDKKTHSITRLRDAIQVTLPAMLKPVRNAHHSTNENAKMERTTLQNMYVNGSQRGSYSNNNQNNGASYYGDMNGSYLGQVGEQSSGMYPMEQPMSQAATPALPASPVQVPPQQNDAMMMQMMGMMQQMMQESTSRRSSLGSSATHPRQQSVTATNGLHVDARPAMEDEEWIE